MRLRDLFSDNDCIRTVSPATIRNIDMWQLAVNFQLILGLVRFRKIVPSWCWQCSGVLVPGEGGCGAGERDWDVPGQGWALASLAAKSWFHRGHASHCWCWSSLVPAPAHTRPYRVDIQTDKARYAGHVRYYTWPADYADQPCVIHDNLWRDQISVSHPSRPKVRRLLHPSVFHNLSFIFIQPRSGPGALPRGRDHFQ